MSWAPKPLADILAQSGRDRAGDQDLPVLSITMKHGLVDQADKFKKRIASSDTSNYRIAYKNELVVGFPIDEGVLGFQTKYPAGIVSPAYDVWMLQREAECHIPYLERYLRSLQARNSYASRMKGAVARRRSLTKVDFLALEVPFPHVDDQIRIAHLLGKVERLIAQRKQHLQQLDDLLKSVFLQMFGDPVANEKGWEKKTAIDYAECIVPGRDKPKSFTGATPWVTTGDLQDLGYTEKSRSEIGLSEDEIKEVRARVVPKSSVLLTCVGDLGIVSICTVDMVINQQLHAFQVSEAMSEEFFLHSLSFQKKYMYQNASQTTLPYMNKTVCNRIPMIRPPKDLQITFAKIVRFVHGIKARYQQSLTDLDALYLALSQQAFNGELDLSRIKLPQQPSAEIGSHGHLIELAASVKSYLDLPELPAELSLSGAGRQAALEYWFQAAKKATPGGRSFQISTLVDAINFRLTVMDDQEQAFSNADYEVLKAWVFEALEAGTLKQTFDDANNSIELKVAQA